MLQNDYVIITTCVLLLSDPISTEGGSEDMQHVGDGLVLISSVSNN